MHCFKFGFNFVSCKNKCEKTSVAGSISPLFRKWKYERSCSWSSDRQSSFLLLTCSPSSSSSSSLLTCSSSGFVGAQVAISKPFPPSPVLSRSADPPTCSARGAIRGLTLRRQRLLLTDRLLPTGRSTHLKCFPRISSCHAPLGRTRESLLGLQKTCWPRKKCTRETSTDVLPIPIHRHAFLSGTAHKLMKSTSSVDTPCCFSPRGTHATSIHSIFRTFPFLSFSKNN